MDLVVEPVNATRWEDLADLFGPNGTYRGCWCQTWRLTSKEFTANGNAGNRAALESLVKSGQQVGLIGYADGKPATWCSVAPRPTFPKVIRSTTIAPPDPEDDSVWSIVCFFVRAGFRRKGLLDPMLAAAVEAARKGGARAIEGYPVDTEGGSKPGALYTGTIELYVRNGFTEVVRPSSGRRVVMRRELD
ncbi:GCN5-related N-acetyltransferase [Kribbella flavida DSM 17836]|uniref:GCN5-related N-acetyltransferase n=1 Tax=Kribbella flavida (strain DSM 17836 / JCM 10339 / NBRC 14399) TaxID=479435 RepID=D2PSL9_KRIFD|nr:GNAT family N-acetyltransferase [Kribbella flavida]ADB33157.1 GCN5-related N-acetyltransferase [Kribbella flavida DSM 17836]